MIYFRNKEGNVYAYHKTDIEQVSRLSELEVQLQEISPHFTDANNDLQEKEGALSALNAELNSINQDDISESDINELNDKIGVSQKEYEDALLIFSKIEAEYQPLKTEYDAVLPVFFDIRENLKIMKKMSTKEVDAYLNPPISKEQLVNEAEQQKQSLLAEASTVIAPLQYAENLGIATADESASLVDWQKYSVYLNRIDTSLAPDIDWPQKP
ncbi:tail fiber assembly protein [Providencia rettgeri]|nr:tail fiber assembly protein [Providencia rettgeri]EIU9514278.1 tail fiber assembly protein [Providencia rettgeri]ELR5093799.1 tail fiber assembly protein [Providencia rettgeri]